jgi:hypothetical protein
LLKKMAGMLPIDYQYKSLMHYREHLDYLPLHEGGPMGIYCATRPPCNEPVSTTTLLVVSLLGSAAAGAVSYASAQTAAKQAELNAKAQADAIGQERSRQALEAGENQRRAVVEQRRVRAQQLASMSSSGAMLGTGTSLAIEADTWAKQQTELADQQRMADLSQRNLGFQQTNTLAMGAQQASQIRSDAVGAAISGLGQAAGSAASAFSTRPQPASGGSTVPAGYKPKSVSQRPAGY